MIWHKITYNGWYAIKYNQTKLNTTLEFLYQSLILLLCLYLFIYIYGFLK